MKLAGLKSVDGAHEESIWAAAWAPTADHRPTAVLLTGALDETVRAWLPDDLAALGSPARGHALGVVSLAAHPAGALAAAVSLDSFIRVFDVDTGASVATLEAPPSEVWGVQFHPKVLIFAEPPLPVPAPVPGPAPSAGSNPTPGASPPLGPSPQHTWPAHPTYPTQQYVWPPPPQSQGYSSWPQAPTQQGPRPPYWQYEAAPQSGWTQLQPGWTQP